MQNVIYEGTFLNFSSKVLHTEHSFSHLLRYWLFGAACPAGGPRPNPLPSFNGIVIHERPLSSPNAVNLLSSLSNFMAEKIPITCHVWKPISYEPSSYVPYLCLKIWETEGDPLRNHNYPPLGKITGLCAVAGDEFQNLRRC